MENYNKNLLREIKEEELLQEYLEEQNIKFQLQPKDIKYLEGQVILVLGAGGTIGEEIVKQLIDKKVKQIILVDNHENSIYNIKRELQEVYGVDSPKAICILGDIRNKIRIKSIFAKYKPNIVFHYANYKSLVLGNISPGEFADVNIGGTRNLLEIASKCDSVKRFIFISSDKAEKPTQSYGRTKRINELLIQEFANTNHQIKFGCMRYCNVLDAAGSFAIQTFKDQIANNRTITIRKMENGEIPSRYYISIDTAAQFAIKSGCECDKGDIFSLDKSSIKPIRIDELVKIIAKKMKIEDIDKWFNEKVRFVKKEKGEKKMEELGKGERLIDAPLIKIPLEKNIDKELLNGSVDKLLKLCDDVSTEVLVEKVLKDVVDLLDKNKEEEDL